VSNKIRQKEFYSKDEAIKFGTENFGNNFSVKVLSLVDGVVTVVDVIEPSSGSNTCSEATPNSDEVNIDDSEETIKTELESLTEED